MLGKIQFSVPFAACIIALLFLKKGTNINLSNVYLPKQKLRERFIDYVIFSEAENRKAQEKPRKGISQLSEVWACLLLHFKFEGNI